MVTIGADVEFFIKDKKKNKIVSAVDIVEGTKENPLKLEHCGIQRDNVLLELNINPSTNCEEFGHNCRNAIWDANNYLKAINVNLCIDNRASHNLDETELSDERAFLFGCDKDYDCWHIDTPSQEIDPFEVGSFRTCGGHVHIGFNNKEEVGPHSILRVGKNCDFLMGVPSLLYDKDLKRRRLYGQAGRIRPKSYGLEYRTLSNFWIFAYKTRHWVFKQALASINSHLCALVEESPEDKESMCKAINEYDIDIALNIIKKYSIFINYEYILPRIKKEFDKKLKTLYAPPSSVEDWSIVTQIPEFFSPGTTT